MVVQPDDWSTVYRPASTSSKTEIKLLKFKYVPNGECEQVPNFEVEWSQLNNRTDTRIDKDYVYVGESNHKEIVPRQLIHVIDYRAAEGVYEAAIDLTDWSHSPDDYENGGLMTMGNRESNLLHNGLYGLHDVCNCERLMFDMNAWKNGDEFDDTVRFINGNGDYIYDHNFEEDSAKPWVCNDCAVPDWSSTWPVDSNGYSVLASSGIGAVSFSLLAPDGTGVSYFSIAGEYGGKKSGDLIIDNGSAYDGLLVPAVYEDWEDVWKEGPGMYWIGMDSMKGIITSQVNVASTTPSEFSVTQNVPNPFNPTTTIGFALPAASQVTIEVFNVAGQKVNTIANEFMSPGSHTVTWDASGFSAGVYFYTVKSGDFSKTMKMTLLK